jgi:hypothetical protein
MMNSCAIEKILWLLALLVVFAVLFLGDVRVIGMTIAVAAAVWYGLISPLADEVRAMNLKSKGSVN